MSTPSDTILPGLGPGPASFREGAAKQVISDMPEPRGWNFNFLGRALYGFALLALFFQNVKMVRSDFGLAASRTGSMRKLCSVCFCPLW